MKISETAKKCGLSPMRKFHPYAVEAESKGRKIYHLNIGQPDIETPKQFFDAIRDFSTPVLEYAASPGIPVMIDAIRGYYQSRLGVAFGSKDILVTTGGSEALMILMQCILDNGSEILIPEPFYPNYRTFINMAGGTIVPIPTSPEEGYHYADAERIEARITENTRAMLICNPGNPTGTTLTEEEMRLLKDIAVKHDLYLICDEVYREFCYDGKGLRSFAEFEDAADRVCIVDSVSKRFSSCGARIGCLISRNAELMGEALKFCQARLSTATLDQVGAAALYSVEEAYFTAVRKEYMHRRDTVMQKLREIPGVIAKEPQGAFYLMAKLPVDDSDAFQKWLLTDFEDHGETVMFAPGAPFYATPGKGVNEVRIAYVLKEADLIRAMELLALGIQAYNNR